MLPAVTGLLLALSFPKAGYGFLAWPAFVPLIVFICRSQSLLRAFLGGFIAGAIQFFALLIWMPGVLTQFGGLSDALAWLAYSLLILVLACYPAAACFLTGFATKTCGSYAIFSFPFIWICFEYLQSISPFGGLPWLLVGYSQSAFLRIIQVADITGVYGISFLVGSMATALSWLLIRRGRGVPSYLPLVVSSIIIGISLYYGSNAIQSWEADVPRHRVAMLQGNISFDDSQDVMIDKLQSGYVKMVDRLDPSATDLLVLPESPTPLSFDTDPAYRKTLEELARRFPFGLVFNNVGDRDAGGVQRYFNSAYFLDGDGELRGVYDKIHLVPFGEYIPLQKLFTFVETITKDVGAFDPGSEYLLVNVGGRPVSAVICFEAVFPGLVRRFVDNGSRLIVNLTNDRWYGDSAAPYQHLEIARLRAIENRRYLLRAANSGISAVIAPSGRITSATGILQEAICEGSFAFQTHRSVYTRYGDVFVFLCAIISCGFVAFAVVKRHIRPRVPVSRSSL